MASGQFGAFFLAATLLSGLFGLLLSIPGDILDDRFNEKDGGGPLWRYAYNFSVKWPFVLSQNTKQPFYYDLYNGYSSISFL